MATPRTLKIATTLLDLAPHPTFTNFAQYIVCFTLRLASRTQRYVPCLFFLATYVTCDHLSRLASLTLVVFCGRELARPNGVAFSMIFWHQCVNDISFHWYLTYIVRRYSDCGVDKLTKTHGWCERHESICAKKMGCCV